MTRSDDFTEIEMKHYSHVPHNKPLQRSGAIKCLAAGELAVC
jgi:hypothetical protein